MIERLWPKKLRDMIADLRAEGDLDEAALKRKKRQYYLAIYVAGPVIFLMALTYLYFGLDTQNKIFMFGFLPLLALSIYLIETEDIKHNKLYNYGVITQATCMQPRTRLTLYGYVMDAEFSLKNGETIRTNILTPEDRKTYNVFWKPRFHEGQVITICYDSKNPKKAVLFSKEKSKTVYLRKTPPAFPPT